MQIPQIKNKNEPIFNKIMFNGSIPSEVNNAPKSVITVATHLSVSTTSKLNSFKTKFMIFNAFSFYNVIITRKKRFVKRFCCKKTTVLSQSPPTFFNCTIFLSSPKIKYDEYSISLPFPSYS